MVYKQYTLLTEKKKWGKFKFHSIINDGVKIIQYKTM